MAPASSPHRRSRRRSVRPRRPRTRASHHSRQGRCGRRPCSPRPVGADATVTPSRPSSIFGRVPSRRRAPAGIGCWKPGSRPRRSARGPRARPSAGRAPRPPAQDFRHRVEDRPQLRVAVALTLHRLRVESERDVVDEHAAVDLGQIDACARHRRRMPPGRRRRRRGRPRGRGRNGSGYPQGCRRRGGRARQRPSRPPPASRRRRPWTRIGAVGHRIAHQLLQIGAERQFDRLDAPFARLLGEFELLRLAAPRFWVVEEDGFRFGAAASGSGAWRRRRRRRGGVKASPATITSAATSGRRWLSPARSRSPRAPEIPTANPRALASLGSKQAVPGGGDPDQQKSEDNQHPGNSCTMTTTARASTNGGRRRAAIAAVRRFSQWRPWSSARAVWSDRLPGDPITNRAGAA